MGLLSRQGSPLPILHSPGAVMGWKSPGPQTLPQRTETPHKQNSSCLVPFLFHLLQASVSGTVGLQKPQKPVWDQDTPTKHSPHAPYLNTRVNKQKYPRDTLKTARKLVKAYSQEGIDNWDTEEMQRVPHSPGSPERDSNLASKCGKSRSG